MNEDIHPSELNPLQRYARTVKLARTTSRLKNPDWYREALELDIQVHCYLKDEGPVECYLYLKASNHYEKIGVLQQRQLEKYDELESFVQKVLSNDGAAKAKSLGVIFYLADELSIASLGPEHQNPAELDNLRGQMIDSPKEVLEDKTVSTETHSWRLFPYPGAAAGNEFATAVAVSRKRGDTLKALREIGEEMNLPIRTCALSAPLCAIATLPWYTEANKDGTVAVFNYAKFTLVAFFNAYCDLMLLRYIPHANGASAPTNLGPAVLATAAAFELEKPQINMVSIAGENVEAAIVNLQSSMMGSEIRLISGQELLKSKGMLAELPVEMLATTQELDTEVYALAANTTFSAFKDEGWYLQDFLSPSREETDLCPDAQDMKLLKAGRLVKKAAAVVLVGFLLYSGFNIWRKISSDAWTYKKQNTQATVKALNERLQRYDHWNNLLKDRSKAWVSMELVSQLVPADGSVILRDVRHQVTPVNEKNSPNKGFKKEWTINGFSDDKGLAYLEAASTRDGIKKIFKNVAELTGNEAYLPDVGQRDVTINFVQKGNTGHSSVDSRGLGAQMPYSFKMVITQSFGAKDTMSIAKNETGTKKKK